MRSKLQTPKVALKMANKDRETEFGNYRNEKVDPKHMAFK